MGYQDSKLFKDNNLNQQQQQQQQNDDSLSRAGGGGGAANRSISQRRGTDNSQVNKDKFRVQGKNVGREFFDFLKKQISSKRGITSSNEVTLKNFWKDSVYRVLKKGMTKGVQKLKHYEKWGNISEADAYKTIQQFAQWEEKQIEADKTARQLKRQELNKKAQQKEDTKLMKIAVEQTFKHRLDKIRMKQQDRMEERSPSPFSRAKKGKQQQQAIQIQDTNVMEETSTMMRDNTFMKKKNQAQKEEEEGGNEDEKEFQLRQNFQSLEQRNDYLNKEQAFFFNLLYKFLTQEKQSKKKFIDSPQEKTLKLRQMDLKISQKNARAEDKTNLQKMLNGQTVLTNNVETLMKFYSRNRSLNSLRWELQGGENGIRKLLQVLLGRQYTIMRLDQLYENQNKNVKEYKRTSKALFFLSMSTKKRALNLLNSPLTYKWLCDIEKAKKQKKQQDQENYRKRQEERQQLEKQQLQSKVLGGKKNIKANNIQQLSKPKDKWLTGRTMKELRKQFPHDRVLQKMIKEQFKENKVFRYPDEYDVYDEEQEQRRKKNMVKQPEMRQTFQKKKNQKQIILNMLQKWKIDDEGKTRIKQKQLNEEKKSQKITDEFLQKKVREYRALCKKRINERVPTQNQFISDAYRQFKQQQPDICQKQFPFVQYGVKPGSKRFKKSFPVEFKRSFFWVYKSFYVDDEGTLNRRKNAPLTYWLPCSNMKSQNKKAEQITALREKKKQQKQLGGECAWLRQDTQSQRMKFLMTDDQIKNCIFQPKLNKYQKQGGGDDLDANKENLDFSQKIGMNFKKAAPSIYKAGLLKQAWQKYRQGNFREARIRLKQGFKIQSLYRNFNPKKLQQLQKKEQLRKEEERKKAEAQGVMLDKIMDQQDKQKQMPEQDPKDPNSKDAWDLWLKLQDDRRVKEIKIKKLLNQLKQKEENSKRKQEKKGSTGRSQRSSSTQRRQELKEFKSIMCPLRDRCPKDIRPRWPMSNISAQTKMGNQCLFAHHPSQLVFKQSDCRTIKGLQKKIEIVQKSIDQDSTNLKKPQKGDQKNVIIKSMIQKAKKLNNSESVLAKKEQKKQSQDFYTKKLGKLRRATVLYNFQRFTQAFKVITQVAKLVKEQKQRDKKRFQNLANKWKFRLKLPKGLDLDGQFRELVERKGRDLNERDLAQIQGDITIQQAHILIQNCFDLDGASKWNKNTYLNERIEDIYILCEDALLGKHKLIKIMKKRVTKLEQEGPQDPEKKIVYRQGEQIEMRLSQVQKKRVMLQSIVSKENTIYNMKKVMQSMKSSLRDLKALKPWRPVKAGRSQNTSMMDMKSKKRANRNNEEDDDDEDGSKAKRYKKISIYERDNLGELPFDIEGNDDDDDDQEEE